MKKIVTLLTGLFLMASLSHAAGLNQDSSWEEILSDDTVKAVFPIVSVGNGKFVTYDHLFLDQNALTTGKTWQDTVEWTRFDSLNSERGPIALRTVTREAVAPLNYSATKCINLIPDTSNSDRTLLVCHPVAEKHSTTVNVKVYKLRKTAGPKDDKGNIYLFTKKYSVPKFQLTQ